jgi:hypothetical protein
MVDFSPEWRGLQMTGVMVGTIFERGIMGQQPKPGGDVEAI